MAVGNVAVGDDEDDGSGSSDSEAFGALMKADATELAARTA